jgi:hypothetical protein
MLSLAAIDASADAFNCGPIRHLERCHIRASIVRRFAAKPKEQYQPQNPEKGAFVPKIEARTG